MQKYVLYSPYDSPMSVILRFFINKVVPPDVNGEKLSFIFIKYTSPILILKNTTTQVVIPWELESRIFCKPKRLNSIILGSIFKLLLIFKVSVVKLVVVELFIVEVVHVKVSIVELVNVEFSEVKLFKLKLFISCEEVDEDLINLLLPESYFIKFESL